MFSVWSPVRFSKSCQEPEEEQEDFKESGNKKLTAVELPGLNHLFQESTTGSPAEYAKIEQTFSPKALEEILKFIRIQTK